MLRSAKLSSFGLLFLWCALCAFPAEYPVSSGAEISTLLPSLQPGDIVTMTNGTWLDADITFMGNGSADSPIVLRAQTAGQVLLSGSSRLSLAGQYLMVDGLQFTNAKRASGDLIAFQVAGNTATFDASNSVLTNCAVLGCNPPNWKNNTIWAHPGRRPTAVKRFA